MSDQPIRDGNETRRLRQVVSPQTAATVVIFLVCLILIGLDVLDVLDQRRKEMADAVQDTGNLTRSLSEHAEAAFRAADLSIIGLVARLQIDGSSPERLGQLSGIMAKRVETSRILTNLFVVDDAGHCLATAEKTPVPDCSFADSENLAHHRAREEPEAHVGPPMRLGGGASWIVPLSRRFNHSDGSFAGIAVAGISIGLLNQFYDTFDIGQQGSILLANTDGTLLVRRPFVERNIGRDLRSSTIFRSYLPTTSVGTAEIRSSTDGIVRVNSFRRVDDYPLVVSVALATDDVLAPWREDLRFRVMRTGGLIVVIAALGIWLLSVIREQRRREEQHLATGTAFRLLAENSTDVIIRTDLQMVRQYISPACRDVLGYEPEELIGRRTDDILFGADRATWLKLFDATDGRVEDIEATYRVVRKDGAVIWIEAQRRRLASGDGFVVSSRDITRRKQAEEELAAANRRLEAIANQDGLTGLSNRRHFDQTLDVEFRRAGRDGSTLSLIMIDVDHFKLFNDRYGHPAGDQCLKEIAEVLRDLPARPADLVARYGGEELVIVLPHTPVLGAQVIAERARVAVRSLAIPHEGNEAKIVTISLGIASATPEARVASAAELIAVADHALYEAKESGRDRACLARRNAPVADGVVAVQVEPVRMKPGAAAE